MYIYSIYFCVCGCVFVCVCMNSPSATGANKYIFFKVIGCHLYKWMPFWIFLVSKRAFLKEGDLKHIHGHVWYLYSKMPDMCELSTYWLCYSWSFSALTFSTKRICLLLLNEKTERILRGTARFKVKNIWLIGN